MHAGEDQELEQERQRLRHAGALHEAVAGRGRGALRRTGGGRRADRRTRAAALEKMARIDPLLAGHAEACAEAVYRLEDLVGGLRGYLQDDRHRRGAPGGGRGAAGCAQPAEAQARRVARGRAGQARAERRRARGSRDAPGRDRVGRRTGWPSCTPRPPRRRSSLSAKRRKAADRFTRKVAAELAGLRMDGTAARGAPCAGSGRPGRGPAPDGGGPGAHGNRGRPGRSDHLAQRGRSPQAARRHRLRRRAVAGGARPEVALRRRPSRWPPSSSTKWMRASAEPSPRWSAASWSKSPNAIR